MPRNTPENPFATAAGAASPLAGLGPAPMRVPDGGEPQKMSRHILRPVEEYVEQDDEQRLRIPENMWPQGFALQWVTESVWGRPEVQHRARFERAGWVSIHAGEFEGKYDYLVNDGYQGEIKCEGLVLMARPRSWNEKARENNINRARQRVFIKEQQLRQGALDGVTLSPQHPTALRSNVVERSIDTIAMPVPQR